MEYDNDFEIYEFIRKGKLDKVKNVISLVGFSHFKIWQNGYMLLYWALVYNHTNIAKWLLAQNCSVNPEYQKGTQMTVLSLAVCTSKVEMVKILLKKGASVTVSNDRLETPLHMSCKKGKPEVFVKNDILTIIKLLLRYGASVNAKGGLCEDTPLLYAVKNKHHCGKIVKLLLNNGANVNDHDMRRNTALHIAVENSDKKMIKLLLEHSADVNIKNCNGQTPLHLAVRGRCIEIAKMLLVNGAGVNDIIYDSEEYRWTALHIAVKNKDEKMIKLLLEYNANVNAKEDYYRTPLHIASVSQCLEVVKILLMAGADVNDADKQGQIPLHLAIRIADERIVEFLIEHNANVHAKRKDGKSCLHFAAGNRSPNIAKILLNKGANINDTTLDGRTVLHCSAKKGSEELVELFLKLGVDVDVKTKIDNFTPLYYAVKKRHCHMAEYLLYHGADVNISVNYYQTLLRLAVYDMNKDMVELLLNWNANINAEDSNDETPLLIATYSSRYEDIPGCEMMHEITDCLVMYVAKLVSENAYVSEENLCLIKQSCRLRIFYEQCQNELENMKSKKIYDNVSYYDILVKSTNTMVSYLRNKNIICAFETSNYMKAFPIYSVMMRKNYERGKVKKQLLEMGAIALKFFFKNNTEQKVSVELPYVVSREILNYLNLKDLRILSVVCQFSPIKNYTGKHKD